VPRDNGKQRKPRFTVPAAFLAAMVALYLIFRQGSGSATVGLREDLLLAAQTGIWLGAAWLGKRLLTAAVMSYSARKVRSGTTTLLIGGGSQLLIDVGTAILFAAAVLGIVAVVYHLPLGGLLATSGVLAALIGFAIQRMIADVFSGLALNLELPFAVGDWIETATGLAGQVLIANWHAVHLVTIEGRAVVVPNSVLANNQFTNLNAPERYFRTRKTITLDYSVPSDRVIPIFQAAMEATEGVPAVPQSVVLIDECSDRGVVYSLNFWVPD
jgi:small-conductance mechanosensitive channel